MSGGGTVARELRPSTKESLHVDLETDPGRRARVRTQLARARRGTQGEARTLQAELSDLRPRRGRQRKLHLLDQAAPVLRGEDLLGRAGQVHRGARLGDRGTVLLG